MKRYLILILLFITISRLEAQSVSFFSNLGSNLDDRATNILVGSNGNVYLLGQSDDTLFVPDSSGNIIAVPPVSQRNFFLTCINSSGQYQWTKMFGYGVIDNSFARFAVNPNGEVVFLICADDFIKIGTDSIPSFGKCLNVLCKLDDSGNLLSHEPIFNILSSGVVESIKTDNNSNIYISGNFRDNLELISTGMIDSVLSPLGHSKNAFFIKYNNALSRIYTKQIGSLIYDFDFSGSQECNLLIEVNNGDSLKIDTALYVPANFSRQQYLVKLNSNGKNIRCIQVGGIDAINFKLLNIQHIQNNFEVLGKLTDTVHIEQQILTPSIPTAIQSNHEEMFSVQFDESTFQLLNVNTFSSYCETGEQVFLKTEPLGNYKYLAYNYSDSVGYDFVNSQIIWNKNIAVKCFDNNYTRLWTKGFASSTDDYAQGIVLDATNNAYVLGLFSDTLQIIDSLEITRTGSSSIISNGGVDIFVGKISSVPVITGIATKEDGESLQVFPNPTTNYIKIINSDGCYKLFDMKGSCIKSGELNTMDGAIIGMKDLPEGIYLIQFLNKEGHIQYAKVMKE
ncbi:MAG: hypothetical protein A3F72_17240 [Bacteroidetes bacterium RIFCSPLOWO2_12_FULL_35_15]|nr:MAG: hypothetical protein A3F72_17240 [Bacteroidetes bacterium RIFCSPLOWO2_12_FULL_35_15]